MDSAESVKRIACIGSGGVASSLLPALYGAGYKISQVFSRNLLSAQALAKVVGASAAGSLAELDANADVYIITVPDGEIENVLRDAKFGNGMVVHTSGSTSIDVFRKYNIGRCGVLYPLQTFSRQRGVNFARVPLYVEAGSSSDTVELMFMARKLSVDVSQADSEKRMMLHIAAVFACNFTNQMLAISSQLTREAGLNFASLKPLIQETFEKAMAADDPAQVQTGPAVRGDMLTVQKHLDALASWPELQQIYKLVSESIMEN